LKFFEKLRKPFQGSLSAFRKKKAKTKRKIVLASVAVVVIAALGIRFVLNANASGDEITYNYVPVERRDITVTLSGTGTVSPINQYEVTSLVSGEILDAPFEEGDVLQKGALLYKIDTGNVENNIEKANVAVEKAQRNYENALESKKNLNVTSDIGGIVKTLYVSEGDNVSNGVKIADVTDNETMTLKLPFNSSDADRIRVGQSASVTLDGSFETLTGTVSAVSSVVRVLDGNMLVRDVTIKVKNPGALTSDMFATASVGSIACNSGANFEPVSEKTITAKTSGEVARIYCDEGARIESGAAIVALENTSIDTEIATNELSLKDSKLSLQNTMDQMDDYNITSPIAGTVIEKDYKTGDTVNSSSGGTTLAVIFDMSSLVFEMSIDELDVSSVKVGQQVTVTADALEGKTFTGVVDKVNIKGTTSNGVTTYPVTVKINESDGLLPGMNVNASIVVESEKDVLAIPVGAVARGNTVLVKRDGGGAPRQTDSESAQSGGRPSGENAPRRNFSGGSTPGQNAPDENAPSGNTSGENNRGGTASGGNTAGRNASGAEAVSRANEDLPDGYVRARVELGISDEDYIEVKNGLSEGETIAIPIVKTTNSQTTSRTAGMGGGMAVGGGAMPPQGGGMRTYTVGGAPGGNSRGG